MPPMNALPFLASSCLIVASAPAAVMVSVLAADPIGAFPVGFGGAWAATHFITDDSAAAFLLDDVTVSMDAATDEGGGFFVAIFSDAGDSPGVLIHTLSGTENPAAAANYTYTASGGSLAPSTSYWVVAGVTEGGGVYNWNVADFAFSTTGSWDIPAAATHITSFGSGGDNWNAVQDGYPRLLSVSATPIPEPTASVLAIVTATFASRRRRRR